MIFGIAFVLSAANDLINHIIIRKLQNRLLKYFKDKNNLENSSWLKIVFSLTLVVVMMFTGTVFFALFEDQFTLVSAFYWVVITMLTIGYGDFTISEDSR